MKFDKPVNKYKLLINLILTNLKYADSINLTELGDPDSDIKSYCRGQLDLSEQLRESILYFVNELEDI